MTNETQYPPKPTMKIKVLKGIEKLCYTGAIGVASILGKYYSKNKLDKYNETSNTSTNTNTPNTSKEEYPLNNSDYAKNLEDYTKIVKSILEEPKNNK